MFINAAGVSPSQAPIEQILKVDLYGTAVLLEEFEKVIIQGGTSVTISNSKPLLEPSFSLIHQSFFSNMPKKGI